MSTTDEIPQQPHITVPETAPPTEQSDEPITSATVDQPSNDQPEQQTNTTADVTMSEAPVEVNQTTPAPQPETVAEKPVEKPVETPTVVAVKEDSVKEELSAGKKKKKNKANLQEKLKQLNDKLNMLNALNKKIESKTGVASSPVMLPLATPALPAQSSLALSGTGEDELSDSKKRKTRPNTLYDDYEIDATARPLKKIGVPVGASPPPMMPQYVAPTTPTPVPPKKAHTPRGRGRPVGRPRGSGQHATYAQPGTYEPEWDEDYEDYEGDNDFDSFAPKGVGRPPKTKRPPRPQPRPVVPMVPYTPVAATLTPPPGCKRRTGQYLPLSAPLQQCAQIATALMKHPMSPPFNIAVDPLALGIPDYWTIIKEPMDLGTIKSWVDGGAYKDIHEFADDVRLVWRNALTYNAPGSQISTMAQTLADFFEQKFTTLINRINNPEAVHSSPVAVEPVIAASPLPVAVQRVEVDPAVLQRRKEMQETLNDLRGLLRSLDKQVTELKKQTTNLPQPPSAKPKARSTRASATRPPPKRRPRDLNLKPMSYEEKCKLSEDINNLNSDHWAGVMAVIEEEMPQALKNDTDEVELDIDALDIVTLRRLEAFIAECQGKPAVVTVTQAPTAAPMVSSPPVPPREPKVKKPKDDEAKQKPKRQPRKKTGPPQSITEETIRETERQLKAVNQSLTSGNASLKNIGDLESKQQSNKEALTRPKKGSHSSSSSDSSDSSDTDSDSSEDGSGDEGVKKKKKDKHHATGGKAPMTSKVTEGEAAGEETAAPKILTPTSPLKKEVVLQNVESWTALDESKPEEGDSNSTGPNNDSLWSEFRTKGQQNKQRMKEREDLEEKQRLEREKKERELKEEEERLKREQREKQEEEERKRMEEMQRRREQERLMREQQSGQTGPESSSESAHQSTILQSMTEQSEMLHSFEHQLMSGHSLDAENKLPLKPVDDEDL